MTNALQRCRALFFLIQTLKVATIALIESNR